MLAPHLSHGERLDWLASIRCPWFENEGVTASQLRGKGVLGQLRVIAVSSGLEKIAIAGLSSLHDNIQNVVFEPESRSQHVSEGIVLRAVPYVTPVVGAGILLSMALDTIST